MPQIDDAPPLKPRRLLRGEITYAAAKEQDANILHELGYRDQKIRFFTHLYQEQYDASLREAFECGSLHG